MKKFFFGTIVGILLCSGIVYAATLYKASDVSYTPSDTSWEVSNAKDALDDLYNSANTSHCASVSGNTITFKVGDYVRMTPTSTSYETDTSMTGYTESQTINPSELNLWRVIRINSDGTVDMVSEYVSSVAVYFSGQTGYQNFIGYLNTIAHQYENKCYTVGARNMGYSTQIPYITDTSALVSKTAPQKSSTSSSNVTSATEAKGLGDVGYETDTNLVKTALGTLKANNPSGTTAYYWLASRNYSYISSSNWDYSGRNVNTSGGIIGSYLHYYTGGFNANILSRAVRPIVTLKSGIQATGSGTSADPYVLS